ncbi:MAG: ComF family protein [Gammaproteobacteria bacterium]
MPAGGWCARCLGSRPAFERTVAGLIYRRPVDILVTRFKYRGQRASGVTLGDVLARAVVCDLERRPDFEWPDRVVPMPLHPARLRSRGFNQSQQLAQQVATATGIAMSAGDCERVRNTPPQSGVTGVKARQANVRGAFRVRPSICGFRVAIVDDVMTTGATANTLARALLAAGATSVEVWASARANASDLASAAAAQTRKAQASR